MKEITEEMTKELEIRQGRPLRLTSSLYFLN
jgi:hypothetical protein